MAINASTKRPRCHEDWQINFSPHEENIIDNDRNDPIVISVVINNFRVGRILVDDGNAMEVLIYDTFTALWSLLINKTDLRLCQPAN